MAAGPHTRTVRIRLQAGRSRTGLMAQDGDTLPCPNLQVRDFFGVNQTLGLQELFCFVSYELI